MRALEVFDFTHYLSGPCDHSVDALDGTSESMLSSGILRNIFIWVLVWDDQYAKYVESKSMGKCNMHWQQICTKINPCQNPDEIVKFQTTPLIWMCYPEHLLSDHSDHLNSE
jgi:hypothetical protein